MVLLIHIEKLYYWLFEGGRENKSADKLLESWKCNGGESWSPEISMDASGCCVCSLTAARLMMSEWKCFCRQQGQKLCSCCVPINASSSILFTGGLTFPQLKKVLMEEIVQTSSFLYFLFLVLFLLLHPQHSVCLGPYSRHYLVFRKLYQVAVQQQQQQMKWF